MAAELSSLKPGSKITCTVVKMPRTEDQESTILRLMRNNPDARKALKRAQRMRMQRVVIYNRGNRDWTKREKTAKVVRVEKDKSWTMTFSLDQLTDFASVSKYVTVKAS